MQTLHAPLPTSPFISVVVCASNLAIQPERSLRALMSLDYSDYEVILVDNVSSRRGFAELAGKFKIRYVREERPGRAHARNRGFAEARGNIIAFTDVSTCPDRAWLRAIADGFRQEDVMAVTGLVVPKEQETPAQVHFEHGGYGLGRGLQRRTFTRFTISKTELLRTQDVGAGVNMAFRRRLLEKVGLFDPIFQADIPSDGSDIDLFHRVLAGGHLIVYEPSALVWFTPKRDELSVNRLAFEQGRALGIYLLRCLRHHTVKRSSLIHFIVHEWMVRRYFKRILKPGKATRRLVLSELSGALTSPLAYARRCSSVQSRSPLHDKIPQDLPVGHEVAAHQKPDASEKPLDRFPNTMAVQIVRTWYPHWGKYSGINQFIRLVDQSRYHLMTRLVQENDNDFPIRNGAVRRWLSYRLKRKDMAWYNLSDFTAEMQCLLSCFYGQPDIIHYLDGEHSAQFLPRLQRLPSRLRPKLIVSYHQPPDVLDHVIRKDMISQWDCIVIVAPEQQEIFSRFTSPEKIRLILHGIDTTYFKPLRRPSQDDTVRCITVGHNYRDYKMVRQVAEQLKGDRRIEFIAVSPRPTGLEGLPNVSIYKGVTDDRLLQLYQQADILFMPLTKATANNALLEGIACGLPVLSTALPSVKAYLPGPEAILIDKNDSQSFSDAILHLVAHPSLRQRMAIAARKRAEELDWSNIAPQYEAIYAQLVHTT
jgi:glycosyltransferase involved in cell wall biosynthesis/GT2 family glycosyltransferase